MRWAWHVGGQDKRGNIPATHRTSENKGKKWFSLIVPLSVTYLWKSCPVFLNFAYSSALGKPYSKKHQESSVFQWCYELSARLGDKLHGRRLNFGRLFLTSDPERLSSIHRSKTPSTYLICSATCTFRFFPRNFLLRLARSRKKCKRRRRSYESGLG